MVIKINRSAGVTLVELSIVLVISGLIIAGVIAGQNLIESTKINSIVSDLQSYSSAYNSFKEKYLLPPGDTLSPQNTWPSAVDTSNSPTLGDGYINWQNGDANYTENFAAWQQLGLAGFIKGSYSGKNSGHGDNGGPAIGIDIPSAPIGAYTIGYFAYNMSTGAFYDYGTIPAAGSYYGNTDSIFVSNGTLDNTEAAGAVPAVLSPQEAYLIDTKIDNGDPTTGKLMAIGNSITDNCITLQSSSTWHIAVSSTYNLANENKDCILINLFNDPEVIEIN